MVYAGLTEAHKHMWSGLLKYTPPKNGVTGRPICGVNVEKNQKNSFSTVTAISQTEVEIPGR